MQGITHLASTIESRQIVHWVSGRSGPKGRWCMVAAAGAGAGAAGAGGLKSPGPHQRGPQLGTHWRTIMDCLDTLLTVMKANHVPVFLVRKFFTQIFCFINVQLFNALLLRRECCSFSNGEYIKTGLAELENWLIEAKAGAYTHPLFSSTSAVSDPKYTLDTPCTTLTTPKHPLNTP